MTGGPFIHHFPSFSNTMEY